MSNKSINNTVFSEAKKYLLSFEGINDSIIDLHLNSWKDYKLNSLPSLFRAMLGNAKNRQGMPNTIGNVDDLSEVLFNFDAQHVVDDYKSWDVLFDIIKKKISTSGRMVKNNPRSYWVVYSKSIMSIASYVSRYMTIEEFKLYVNQFVNSDTPDTMIALPLLLEKEIFGYKFALACDFLKENVDPHFVKPDTHIRDIFIGLGYSPEGASDYQVFRDVIAFAESIDVLPYVVDKLFWLVGSGRFYDSGIRVKTSKHEFIVSTNKLIK